MSHVVEKNLTEEQYIKDLAVLQAAAERMGLTVNEGVKSFEYWSGSTDRCAHMISGLETGHQMGLVGIPEHEGAFTIKSDAYDTDAVDELLQFYQLEEARATAMVMGDIYAEEVQDNGDIVATVDTSLRMGV